jgi:penicillin amidase
MMSRTPIKHPCAFIACAFLFVHASRAQDVRVLRDPWGIPHVFAETDADAFYGLGHATAEDRAFQMTYSLRIIQGRLAEVIGEVRQVNRDDTSVDHDRMMRTFGFARAARRTADSLGPEMRGLLQSYCDGVNAYFLEHRDDLNPMFARTGLKPEPWTPADCLASWWHLGQFFATDGTRDLIAGRGVLAPFPDAELDDLVPLPPDDTTAVVKRSDVARDWVDKVFGFADEFGYRDGRGRPAEDGPKFSHAWVVGGRRTTTGSSVLVSDPQTPVRNPSLFYEFHIRGRTFNARGIGVPGSPIILIGFTDKVAWGVTALGADQADLFQLDTNPQHPDQYRFDGEWRPMTVVHETIQVKGQAPVEMILKETHLGPVATAFSFAQPGDPEVALKRVPTCDVDRETIQGAVAMMRAGGVRAFDEALAGWRFPSANMVFGDREGHIGYRVVGAIPVRSSLDPSRGREARPGHRSDQDWRGFVPHELLPGVINPASGHLFSANHRPIGSWYPLDLGTMTGGGGDTLRSWRLRERLERKGPFTPEQVLEVHFDAVNPARRDIVRLGLHLRDGLRRDLSADALQALAHLEAWHRAGASTSLDQPGAELAAEINTFFRILSTDLAFVYGGGESGLAYFLKSATARLDKGPRAELSKREQDFIDRALAGGWRSATKKYGEEPTAWNAKARDSLGQQRMAYLQGLDGFPGLDPDLALSSPALIRIDGGTIGCQTAQSYTQFVPMHDPDQALSLLPIGQSERADHPSRTSTLALWGEGRLHPAPLSEEKVKALGATTWRPKPGSSTQSK